MLKKMKYDIILFTSILLVAALLSVYLYLNRSEGVICRVTLNGELYSEYPLNTDIQVVIGDGDYYNILVISNGKAYVIEASCPDKLCVKQGKIHYDGQSIICLPNKMIAEIIGGQTEFDAVVK